MNRAAVALAALLLSLMAAAGGYFYGHQQGALSESAKRDSQTVQSLTSLIDAHKDLIAQASKASLSMRQALARRALLDTTTTKEFKDALNATADSRAGCVFDAGVMRQLSAARDRAAQAAASGIHNPLPGTTTGASQP